jgi:hypothetical protein
MEYVPESAQFDTNTKSYDVIQQFTANVRASSDARDPRSPEFEVLELLDIPDDRYVELFTKRVNDYLQNIANRFSTGDVAKQAAVDEYMLLAEGRRRLFKGFEDSKPDGVGLDEFRLTLPIAVQPAELPLTQMTEAGDVEIMPPKEAIKITGPLKSSGSLARMPDSHNGYSLGAGSLSHKSCPAHRTWVRRALA